MSFTTIVSDFLYFALGTGAISTAAIIVADVYGRKSKKDEYLSTLEAMERIHAAKKIKETAEESSEAKKQ